MNTLEFTPYLLRGGVDRLRGAELGRQLPSGLRQVDRHDIGQSTVGQARDRREADRTAAEYRDLVVDADVELFGGMHTDGDRLRKSRDGQRHIVGDRE